MRDTEKAEIRRELDALREEGQRRQALSWHACQRLFFDFGIRPSVAAVRELTGTGSASDIPKDIESFWSRVRTASQVRAAQGAIPQALELRAGELLGELYRAAFDAARGELESERASLSERQAGLEHSAHEAHRQAEHAREALALAQQQCAEQILRREQAEQRIAVLEGEAGLRTERAQGERAQLETRVLALEQRLSEREAALSALRREHEALHIDAQGNAEQYAAQLKDAIDDAQRRVRPLLLELDQLRTASAAHQSGIKDASRRDFENIQQLSLIKGRADTLERLANRQADELAQLHRELALAAQRGQTQPEVAQLLVQLALRGGLSAAEMAALGTCVDAHVTVPVRCSACADGEPELGDFDGRVEISCPECGHSSGPCSSRVEAAVVFQRPAGAGVQPG